MLFTYLRVVVYRWLNETHAELDKLEEASPGPQTEEQIRAIRDAYRYGNPEGSRIQYPNIDLFRQHGKLVTKLQALPLEDKTVRRLL